MNVDGDSNLCFIIVLVYEDRKFVEIFSNTFWTYFMLSFFFQRIRYKIDFSDEDC